MGANVPVQSPSTLAIRKVAIVFVPGVMGSRLHFDSTNGTHDWDPDTTLSMADWLATTASVMKNWIGVKTGGTVTLMRTPPQRRSQRWVKDLSRSDTALSQDQIDRCFPTVSMASYGAFLTDLDAAVDPSQPFWDPTPPTPFAAGFSIKLYAYGYDWRKPIQDLGAALAADTVGGAGGTGIFGSSPLVNPDDPNRPHFVIFITHSMGGLVTRSALKQSAKLQSLTAGVLHGVQPATGATTFYRRCITGCVADWDGDANFCKILGSDGPAFATVVSDLPGPVNLFPGSRLSKDLANNNTPGAISYTVYEDTNISDPLHPSTEDYATRYIRLCFNWPERGATDIYAVSNGNENSFPPGVLRTDVDDDSRNGLRRLLNATKAFHESIARDGTANGSPWYLDGKTWAYFGTGNKSDSTMHYYLYRTIKRRGPFGLGDYYVNDSFGAERVLDKKLAIDWKGYQESPPFITDPTSPIGPRVGRSAHGDGTVPDISGSALFGLSEQNAIDAASIDFSKQHQFVKSGLEHEPAYRDATVQAFVKRWLKYVLSQLPPETH